MDTGKPIEVGGAAKPDANGVKERIDAFIKDYGELRNKHKIDIASAPSFVPNDRGTWELVINMQPVDISNELIKSPFIPQ
jgi:hypothetical protein